jgi:branched-chain amino acid aminotransferase
VTTVINIDGTIFGQDEAKINVFDRGFLYGDSVYEVIRSYGMIPFALKEHLFRLRRSADMLDMEIPVPLTKIESEIKRTIAEARGGDCYIRVICTRGEGEITLDPAMAVAPHYVIIVKEYKPPPRHLYTEGASVILVKSGRLLDGALPPGTKTGNYLVNLMALARAKQKGSYEAIMIDGTGKVAEGTTCNFFIVKRGRIFTPSLETGILAGITRGIVLELSRRWGFFAEEKDLFPKDMREADEAFLTSTIRDVMPVTIIDEMPVRNGRPGPLTENIRRAYLEYVKEYIAKYKM